jgi:hypothetical protein
MTAAAEDHAVSDHGTWQELATLDALGMLESSDFGTWQPHFASCKPCQRELRDMAELVGELAYSAPRARPPTALRERILVTATPRRTP